MPTYKNSWREDNGIVRIAMVTALILLIPLIAMLFTDEVAWTASDFVVVGILIFGTGLVYERVVKGIPNPTHRAFAGLTLALIFFLIWAQMAVGLIGKILTGELWAS